MNYKVSCCLAYALRIGGGHRQVDRIKGRPEGSCLPVDKTKRITEGEVIVRAVRRYRSFKQPVTVKHLIIKRFFSAAANSDTEEKGDIKIGRASCRERV